MFTILLFNINKYISNEQNNICIHVDKKDILLEL